MPGAAAVEATLFRPPAGGVTLGAIDAPSIPALLGGLAGLVVAGFVGWIVTSGLIWVIGVKFMGCTSDYGELLRTLGFASAPKILFLLGVLPLGVASYALGFAVMLLSTVASVLAVRHALDVTTGRAIAVCVTAMMVSFMVALVVGTVTGVGMGLAQ